MFLFEVFLLVCKHWEGSKHCENPHGSDAFSPGFEVVEYFATAINRLTVEKFLDEPKDESWFAELCVVRQHLCMHF